MIKDQATEMGSIRMRVTEKQAQTVEDLLEKGFGCSFVSEMTGVPFEYVVLLDIKLTTKYGCL